MKRTQSKVQGPKLGPQGRDHLGDSSKKSRAKFMVLEHLPSKNYSTPLQGFFKFEKIKSIMLTSGI